MFLRLYAGAPRKFSLSDPRVEHISSCGYCLHRLLDIRAAQRHGVNPRASFLGNRFSAVAAAGFVCLLICLLMVKLWYHRPPLSITTQSVMARRTLDLSDYGTYRGEQAPSVPVLSLPAALVKLKLILARFSGPGNYFVVVAPDRSRRNRIAGVKAVAIGADPRTLLTVTLDLRNGARQICGHLISRSAFPIGHGYHLVVPVAAYKSWQGMQIEGNGVEPDFPSPWSYEDAIEQRDSQLEEALQVLEQL